LSDAARRFLFDEQYSPFQDFLFCAVDSSTTIAIVNCPEYQIIFTDE
jgi:hypothetical protein